MLRKLQALFMVVVDKAEGHPAPPNRYFQLFFAILAVRLALEFFSNQRLFTLADVIHIGLWFVFIVLAFMLQLHLFSGVAMQRVAKLVVVCFTIALTAPIIDLVVRGGMPAKMNYLSGSTWAAIGYNYVTLGGASLSRGATLGIRIEIVLLVVASFNYLRTKTGSILKATLGAWCIYTVLFISGMVPRILTWINDSLRLAYAPDDQSTVLLLLCLDLALIFGVLGRYSPQWMGQLFRAVPWTGVTVGAGNFTLGGLLAVQAYPQNWALNPTTLFWFPLMGATGLALGVFAGMERLRQRSAPTGIQQAMLRNGLLLVLLVTGFAISERVLFGTMVVWGLIFLLHEEPLRLRQVPVLRELVEALALLACALVGFAAFGGPMVGFPKTWLAALVGGGFTGSLLVNAIRRRLAHGKG